MKLLPGQVILFSVLLMLSVPLAFSMEALKGRAFFVDRCSGLPSSVTTPNGSSLRVQLNNLNLARDLRITIRYQIAGIAEDISRQHSFQYQYNYQPGEFDRSFDALFKLPKDRILNAVESQIPGSRIWQASVIWEQGSTLGQTVDTLLRLDQARVFYKMKSEVLCHWTTSPVISSSYYFNLDQPVMWLKRVVKDDSQVGSSLARDPMNPINAGWPIQSPGANQSGEGVYGISGFYFSGRDQESFLNQIMTLERTWTLYQNQGGVFADRYSFSRLEADRYDWVDKGGACGQYQKVSSGYVDVGTRVSEFYSTPRSFSEDPNQTTRFIQSYIPNLDTCSARGLSKPEAIQIDSHSSDEYLLYKENP